MSSSTLAPKPKVWDVAALVLAIGDALNARFAYVAVRGEISGFTRASSGHCYFVLKDNEGRVAIRCVMFRRAAVLAGFEPQDGDDIELRGRIAVYEPRGALQLVAESLQRAGDGVLLERFRRLQAELAAEGLFEEERKRPVAPHPRVLGIVTSTTAAALQDVLASLARRAPHVAVCVFAAPVQGPEAPALLADAIGAAGRLAGIDTVLLVRGGGSLEDLWAFNEPLVVRAVAACERPVIVGVGHETDTTLADLAADLRAATPTAAAELATASREQSLDDLDALAERGRRAVARRLEGQAQALDRCAWRVARPTRVLALSQQKLQALGERQRAALRHDLQRRARQGSAAGHRLAAAGQRLVSLARRRLDVVEARLGSLDPRRVLARGYAWLADGEGRTLTSIATLQAGEAVTARLADGEIDARITALRPRTPSDP